MRDFLENGADHINLLEAWEALISKLRLKHCFVLFKNLQTLCLKYLKNISATSTLYILEVNIISQLVSFFKNACFRNRLRKYPCNYLLIFLFLFLLRIQVPGVTKWQSSNKLFLPLPLGDITEILPMSCKALNDQSPPLPIFLLHL